MAKSAMDANVNTSIFRKDHIVVLAARRELATFSPVRLALQSADILAGTVLARNAGTGLYDKYSAISGSSAAVGVLFDSVTTTDQPATGGAAVRLVIGGLVFKTALVDYSSQAKTDLGAKEITDATGVTIVKF